MQRASNVQDISLNHLAWADDCMQLYIFVTKNNQDGEKSEHPKHIFPNPIIPFICPVLSLGIYFSLVDFRTNETRLFGGSNQSERFRQFLARSLKQPEIRDSLAALGFDEEKLGIHSTRKGAATFCLSGTTAPPSQASIDNRGGWSQGKVKNVYQHFSEPGDSYVGRLVCGLPRNSVNFAILPPRFKPSSNNEFVMDALRTCFPTLNHSIHNVGKFALASLVHHAEYLREVLPPNHILFKTILFRNHQLLNALKEMIISGHASSLDDLAATGVPPDVFLHTAIEKIPRDVDEILQERSIAANQVTPEFVSNLLQENYRQIKSIIQPTTSIEPITESNSTIPHVWGGHFHLLPKDYKIPKTTGRIVWQHWFLGDSISEIPPLRRVGTQCIQKSERKRFSDLKYFIKKLTDILKETGQYIENPSPLQVTQMYEAAFQRLGISSNSATNRKRRGGELVWTTTVRNLRTQ